MTILGVDCDRESSLTRRYTCDCARIVARVRMNQEHATRMNQQGPHVGLIGLAVMGENLALNIARNGFPMVVYNRTTLRTEEYLAGPAAGTGISGVPTLPELVAALSRPRQIILMVKAGVPVDAVLTELAPLLDPGDIIVDGGNSHFRDTERRE